MEEDIKVLEDFKNNNFQKDKLERNEKGGFKIGTIYKTTELNPAIENLINKCKELRQELVKYEMQAGKLNQNMVSALEEAFKYSLEIKDLEKQNKEQEKMIELMAKDIANNDFDEDICRTMKVDEMWCGSTDEECKNCVIEYYKKKAR